MKKIAAFLLVLAFFFTPADAFAGSRFWVGGTGNWDAVTNTHWSGSSGGAGGSAVPGSGDTVTFDGNSGGGTVTPTVDVNVQNITCGAFTGTLDWSANNKNVTLNLTSSGLNCSGTGTRTVNMGNGTWTLAGGVFTFATTTGLTFNANNSNIIFSGGLTGNITSFASGGLTYNNVTFNASNNGYAVTGAGNIAGTFTVNNCFVTFASSTTFTVGTLAIASSVSSPATFMTATQLTAATLSTASSPTMDGMVFRGMTFTGGGTFNATNSLDLKGNTGITISAPTGASATGIIRSGVGR